MISYSTYIDIPNSDFEIAYKDGVMFIGSCFAENIGMKMAEYRFNVEINPFGTLYNPLSVASCCRRLLYPKAYVSEDLFFHNEMYHSFMHHGEFSGISETDCLGKMNTSLHSTAEHFRDASYLIITFGTSYVYRNKCDGQIVANCHKLPAAQFEMELLTVDMIVAEWSGLLSSIRRINPSMKVIFTVSPIRHLKEGAHQNQISKAILLLAVEALIKQSSGNISYFPAYELILDELRDYRFYADDMLHPSPVAIDYIWERFCNTYMCEDTKKNMIEVGVINKALSHRPFNAFTDAYKAFLIQTLLKIQQLQDKNPYICLSEEKERLTSKLHNL